MILALIAIVGVEAWGRVQRLTAKPVNLLHEFCAKDLEESTRRLAIPDDARVLVLTSLIEPLPIAFPLAPRVLTLRAHFPATWFERTDVPMAEGLRDELLLTVETLKARGFWAEPADLPDLFAANDFVVTIGLASPLLEVVESAHDLAPLGSNDMPDESAYPGSVWFEVKR